jgi:hypothetical protein
METPQEQRKTYTNSHKTYYEKNKEQILAKYRETKPYISHYERNRDKLKAKALERYYQKKMQREEEQQGQEIQA